MSTISTLHRLSTQIKSQFESITPLTLPFLLLRLNQYNPTTLVPYRTLLETKLTRLRLATCSEGLGSYLKDLSDTIKQPNCPKWLADLYHQISIPISRTSSPSRLSQSLNPPLRKKQKQNNSTTSLTTLLPLSECSLWSKQIEYYSEMGLEAWTSGDVPYQISNSPALASSYVTCILNWLHTQSSFFSNKTPDSTIIYVLEFGAGHCKLGYHLATEIAARRLQNQHQHQHQLQPIPKICIVMCDLSLEVLQDRMQLPYFQQLMQNGQVDFARVDVTKGVNNIHLLFKNINISTMNNPIAIVGNYFLDSLPIDMYRTAKSSGRLEKLCVLEEEKNEIKKQPSKSKSKSKSIGCSSSWRKTMDFRWQPASINEMTTITKSNGESYTSTVLTEYITTHLAQHNTTEGTEDNTTDKHACLMIPIGALRFILDVTSSLVVPGTNCLFLFGDKTFGSRTPFVIEGDKKHDYPIIVHHGKNETETEPEIINGGCISTSVDLSLISSLINQIGITAENNEIVRNSKQQSCIQQSATRRQRMSPLHIEKTRKYTTLIMEDRTTGSGGEFDVVVSSTRGDILVHSNGTQFSHVDQQGNVVRTNCRNNTVPINVFNAFDSHRNRTFVNVSDLEAIVSLTETEINAYTMEHLIDVLFLSNYDYMIFDLMKWFLIRKFELNYSMSISSENELKKKTLNGIVDVGLKCYNNWYAVVSNENISLEQDQTILEFGRWLYCLGSYTRCVEIVNVYFVKHETKVDLTVTGNNEMHQKMMKLKTKASDKMY